jgi:hypothetical protein
MPAVVVDTHAIVWYLSVDFRLSANAPDALDSATAAGERIHVPSSTAPSLMPFSQ